jgi:chromosome segregation ATPase
MKKKLTLLLLAAALVGVGGTAPLVPTLQAATTELKSALNDTKAEIKALKKDIRTLESNVSKATKSLDKSRKSEAKLRQACDAMESKLSAKKTVYQLLEGRIAAGTSELLRARRSGC